MPPEGQAWDEPALGQVLQAAGVDEPTLIVESCLAMFFESQCGHLSLDMAEVLDRSLSKGLAQSLQMNS